MHQHPLALPPPAANAPTHQHLSVTNPNLALDAFVPAEQRIERAVKYYFDVDKHEWQKTHTLIRMAPKYFAEG
jgi:hypothetical protein